MPGFSITPVSAFPPAASDGFPRFIQFQVNGVDVGDTAVETVNFVGDVSLTLNTAGSTVTVQIRELFEWQDVPADHTIAAGDIGTGLKTISGTGTQFITVPPPSELDCSDGAGILIRQAGGARVEFVVPTGSNPLVYRDFVFAAAVAGEGGVVTLVCDLTADEWVLCGDLESL